MVGPRIYHIKHARSYPAFTADDPAKVMDLAVQWLKRHDFRTKRKSRQYSRGSKKGIHVNFVPKFKLYIEQGPNGHYVVRFDYYAKIKLGTAVVVGVLTSGISTVVGVGTLAIALSDADHFVDKFWKHIDSLARGNPVILTVERWASDGKGGFVKQPLPPGAAVPAGQPLPPPPTPPHGHAPPPPPPMHIDNRPRDNRPPPPIQPGQVYGHSLIQAPVQTNAPPPVPPYYPKLDKSGAIPPPPPATAAAYGNYPPPQSPHGHHYPPPPSPHHAYPHPPPPPHGQAYQAPSGHGYPPPPPAHGYPPPNPSGHGYPPQPPHSHGHNYQPPTPGGYPPPPPSQHSQRPPPPTQQQRPSAPPQQQAPRRPSNPSQGNYGDPYRSSHDSVQASSHDRYSSQASPHDRYGSQASPHDRYGSQASPHDRYGSQASSHDKYGSQTSSHDKYGSQASSHDEYASQGDSYSAYYDTHGDRQSYYGGDNASQQRYSYSAFTDVDGSYHETSYYEKHASTGSDDIPDSASTFAEQQGLGRYAEHPFFSDKNSQGSKASNPAS